MSLTQAIYRVADHWNCPRLGSDVPAALHGALCASDLIARGREEDRNGTIIQEDCEIPAAAWRSMSDTQFLAWYSNPRFPLQPLDDPRPIATHYYAHITLARDDVDTWATSDRVPKVEARMKDASDSSLIEPVKNKPGGGGLKKEAAIEAMINAVNDGSQTFNQLRRMKQKALATIYPDAKRTLLAEARREALKRLAAPTPKSDKAAT